MEEERLVESDNYVEEHLFEDNRDAMERETINRVAKMAFASNRDEREELISLRKKMIQVQQYLRKNGISMADCENSTLINDARFNTGFTDPNLFKSGRDEFGLPVFKSADIGEDGKIKNAEKLFVDMPQYNGKQKMNMQDLENTSERIDDIMASQSGLKGILKK